MTDDFGGEPVSPEEIDQQQPDMFAAAESYRTNPRTRAEFERAVGRIPRGNRPGIPFAQSMDEINAKGHNVGVASLSNATDDFGGEKIAVDDFGGEPVEAGDFGGEPLTEADQLGLIFDTAKEQGLDNIVKATAVAEATGLPISLVKHQLPAWEAKMQAVQFNPERFLADYPALSRLILQKPQLAPSFIKDQGPMSRLEGLLGSAWRWFTGEALLTQIGGVAEDVSVGLEINKLDQRVKEIAIKQYRAARGMGPVPSAEELKEADEIEKEKPFLDALRPDIGLLAMPGEAAQQIHNITDMFAGSAYYAGLGATAGAAFGAPAGGVGAIPGALTGAGVGLALGGFMYTKESEAALFYRGALQAGANAQEAAGVAEWVGYVNGLLEILPLNKVLRLVPGARAVLRGPTSDLARRWLKQPGVINALLRQGGRMGLGMAAEGATEFGQETSSIIGEQWLASHDLSTSLAAVWQDMINPLTGESSRQWESLTKGAMAGGGMNLASPFTVMENYAEIKEARQAVERVQLWQALGDTMSGSETVKAYPQATVTLVNEIRKQYGIFKAVSLPAGKLIEAFQAEGLQQEDVAKLMPDVARQMESTDPDAEVTIKLDDFIAHVAPLSGYKALAQDIRPLGEKEQPTAREAPEVEREAQKILAEVAEREKAKQEAKTAGGEKPLPSLEVYEAVRTALIGIEMDPEEASKNAALWQAFANTRAARKGTNPIEEFKKWNVAFVRAPEAIKMSLKDKKGTLSLYQRDDPRLTPHQRELYVLAEESEDKGERERALDELVSSLMHDELTGADTPNSWQRFAPKDAFGNYVGSQPGWYVSIDVNDLKRVNDTFGGHGAGDVLLGTLGRTIGPIARERKGKFFRSGGDEFMLHFRTQAEAEAAIDAIDRAVNKLPFMFEGAHKASISVGLGRDPTRADAASYKAKEEARLNGRSGFGRPGAVPTANLDAGDVFVKRDLSFTKEEMEALFQGADSSTGDVIFSKDLDPEKLTDHDTYAAFRLPDGKVAITGAVHDISGLPEEVKAQHFSDPNWYDNASRRNVEGALVHGRALKGGRFFATEDIETFRQTAFHGSPYTFDQFMLKHLSSGEGAQAFGWGLYFAQRREVAKSYKFQKEPTTTTFYKGQEVKDTQAVGRLQQHPADYTVEQEVIDEVAAHLGSGAYDAAGAVREARGRFTNNITYYRDQIEGLEKRVERLKAKAQGEDTTPNDPTEQRPYDGDITLEDAEKELKDAWKQINRATQAIMAVDKLDPKDFTTGQDFYEHTSLTLDGQRAENYVLGTPTREALDAIKFHLGATLEKATPEQMEEARKQSIESTIKAAEEEEQHVKEYEEEIADLESRNAGGTLSYRIRSKTRAMDRVGAHLDSLLETITSLESLDVSKLGVAAPTAPQPRLYQVNIPEDDILLDYDVPMHSQPAKVLEALANGGVIHKSFPKLAALLQEQSAIHAEWSTEYAKLQAMQIGAIMDGRETNIPRLPAGDEGRGMAKATAGVHAEFNIPSVSQEEDAQIKKVADLDSKHDDLDQEIERLKTEIRTSEFVEGGDTSFELHVLPNESGWDFYQKLAHQQADLKGVNQDVRNRGEQQASERLLKAGIPGLRFLDGFSRYEGQGSHNFVIWDEEAIKIMETWKQLHESQVRGKFETTTARDFFRITLSGKANLSTFLHESGHAFLAILERDAMSGDGGSLEELATIHNWLNPMDAAKAAKTYPAGSFMQYRETEGGKNRAVVGKVLSHSEKGIHVEDYSGRKVTVGLDQIVPDKMKKLTRAQYEQFARGFEAYLREGKAPSSKLREAFESFKAWLINIYSTIFKLDVTLNDEIRGAMDRLLATDIEIAEAAQKMGLTPLEDPQGVMPTEEYRDYRVRFEDAVRTAREAADRASIREFQRAQGAERRMLERQVARAALDNLVLNARELITNGRRLSDVVSKDALMFAGRKLDRAALDGLPLDKRQKGRLMALTEEGGLDPNLLAKALGMRDGAELIMGLGSMPVMKVWVRQETDRRMGEKYKGYQNNRQWQQLNATRALHIAEVGNAIWAGMVAMTKKMGGKAGKSAKMAIQAAAKRKAGQMTVLEMRPHMAMREEARAAKEVAEAWKAGDLRLAYDAARRQLFYHYLWQEMDGAKGEVERITNYFETFKDIDKRKRLGKGGADLVTAIDTVLRTIEYGETLEKGQSLSAAIKEIRDQGHPVLLPADFDFKTLEGDYEAMNLDNLHLIENVVKNLEHIARQNAKEIIKGEKLAFQDLTSSLSMTIRQNLGKQLPAEAPPGGLVQINPTGWEKFVSNIRSARWHLAKVEYMARVLDGGQTAGFFHKYGFQPIANSEAAEHAMMRDVFVKLRTEFKKKPFMERLRRDKRVTFLGHSIPMRDLLMVAFNMRNDGNADRLMRDRMWSRDAIVAELDKFLTDDDVAVVNGIGDLIESLWPHVVRVYKAVYGVEPQKVEGKDIVLPKSKRVLKGGYFPIIRDPDRDQGPDVHAQDLWDEGFVSAVVGHGFTESRSKKADTKLWLNLDALPGHFVKVIHFITHFESTHMVDRILKDKGVKSAISEGLAPEAYAEMQAWIKDVVKGGETGAEVVTGFDKYLRHTRTGATAVLLGARMSTALIQGMGLTMTMKELSTSKDGQGKIVSVSGHKYMLLGAWQVMKDFSTWLRGEGPSPFKAIEKVNDAWILHRENYERDLRLEYKRLTSALAEVGHAKKRIAEFSMAFFNLVQGTVNAITWHAALRKAEAEGHARPEDYANSVIRLSQSAGGPKDLAGIQRGPEWKRWATVLYSFANIIFNATSEPSPKHLTTAQAMGNKAAQLWWVILAPAVITTLINGDDDDFDDPESFIKAVGVESTLAGARSIPLVGDAARAFFGQQAKQAPWMDFMYKGITTAGKAVGASEGDPSERDYQNLINAMGVITHVPTQAGINIYKYMDGIDSMEDHMLNLFLRTPAHYK